MRPQKGCVSVIFLLILCLGSATLTAQQGELIEKVEVRGNHRIPQDSVIFYIMTRPGDVYDQQKILQDFNALYRTNLFRNVKVDVTAGQTGKIVTFIVEEKPIIRSIEYEGIKSFKKSDVLDKFSEEKLGLSVDSPFEPTKTKKAERIIMNLLVLNGRPLGKVDSIIEDIPPNSVKITFKVTEGEKVRIGKITFTGIKVFNNGKLKDTLKLDKERGIISMFKGTDKYHHDKLLYDIDENVKALYHQHGYLDVKFGEPEVEITTGPRGFLPLFRKTKKQFYITIPVEEGRQYRVNSIAFEGNTLFKSEQLIKGINLKKGEIANFKAVKDGMEEIKKLYGMYGYIDFDIVPNTKYDQENLLVDITFNIDQGKQYRVNQIEFFGNTRTRDKVLRREFALIEQEVFSQAMLDLSLQRLNQLGLFEKLEEKDYQIKRNADDGTVDVNLTVQERGQQSVGFTGGFSGYQGSFIGVNYSTNNFLGYGERLGLDMILGSKILNFSFDFTDPYFLDTNTLLGFSVYRTRYRYDYNMYSYIQYENPESLYTQKTLGFNVTLGRPLTTFWRYYFTYKYQLLSFPEDDINSSYRPQLEYTIAGINPGLSLEDAFDGMLRSEVTARLSYNSTDAFFFPTRGREIDAGVSMAGSIFGGDFNIITPYVDMKLYLRDRLISRGRNVLALHARGQYTRPYGDTIAVPLFERYVMGGENDIRGFDIRSVSPMAIMSTIQRDTDGNPLIDPDTGLPQRVDVPTVLGGDLSVLGQLEYRIPVAGPVSLALFVDAGMTTVTQRNKLGFSETTQVYLLEATNRKPRSSAGLELQFMLPMVNAPFRLIFAYNTLRMNTDIMYYDHSNQVFKTLNWREPKTNIQFTIGKSF